MKTFFLTILIGWTSVLPASESIFQQRLQEAKNGDYIVAEFNSAVTVFAIRSNTPHSLILEEISAPSSALNPRPSSWSQWIRSQAPGHTSWSMIEIDPIEKEVVECYSFTRCAWIHLSRQDSLVCTLLDLPLKPLPEQEQRRIGPPPAQGESDRRKLWRPPLASEGGKELLKFDVFSGLWPQDSSPLSGSHLTLYFDRAKEFPFPAWIQIETTHADVSLRVIDAGHLLPSIHRSLPRRIPQFVGTAQKTEQGIRLCLKSPKYYRNFELFAVDITTKEKQIFPIDHILSKEEGDLVFIDIEQEELQTALKSAHRYTWLIVPVGHTESYSESSKPFTWQGDR